MTATEPGRDETQEYVLRAMAANYTSGGIIDHLDLEVFTKAADEIKRLRARLSTPADQAVREATIADEILAPALVVAWDRYVNLFGEPPHGTTKQMRALLRLVRSLTTERS